MRLHTTGYLFIEDATIADKLLSCSFEKNFKELDTILRLGRLFQRIDPRIEKTIIAYPERLFLMQNLNDLRLK